MAQDKRIMNKKGSEFLFVISIILILLFVCLVVYLILMARSNKGEEECRADCKSYDAEFVEYEMPGYKNEECWCRKGNEPIRIR